MNGWNFLSRVQFLSESVVQRMCPLVSEKVMGKHIYLASIIFFPRLFGIVERRTRLMCLRLVLESGWQDEIQITGLEIES